MKKITKNFAMATKVLMVALLMTAVTVDSFAQDKEKKEKKAKKEKVAKELTRPAKVGNGDVDAYAASAFDIYEKNQKISKTLSDDGANKTELAADLKKQLIDIKDLLGKSKAAGDAASSMPMKDKPKGVKAVKAGTDALNATQAAIPGQLDMISGK